MEPQVLPGLGFSITLSPHGGRFPCAAGQTHPDSDLVLYAPNVPPQSGFGFTPSQYVDVLLKDGPRRSYSMASVATRGDLAEAKLLN